MTTRPSDHPTITRQTFASTAVPNSQGRFDVLLITAGQANGWNFSAQVLRDSLNLWEGCECFIDHLDRMDSVHSVRDLCGVFHHVHFDQDAQGIRATLKTLGPSGALASQLGKEWLAESEPRPAIGFSVDISFKSSGRDVLEITRAYSCDLVFEPARGGAFIRALNPVPNASEGAVHVNSVHEHSIGGVSRQKGVESMDLKTQRQRMHHAENDRAGGGVTSPPPAPVEPQEPGAPPDLLNGQAQAQSAQSQYAQAQVAQAQFAQAQFAQAQFASAAEQARVARLQMCAYLLDSALAASQLPTSVQSRLRARFADRLFDAAELRSEIQDARNLVSELTGGQSVSGLRAAVSQMYNSDDQLRLALEDMLGIERAAPEKNVHVARLSGVRELYLGMTGAHDAWGGEDPARARFQHTTTTFAGLVKNALNKSLVNHWAQLGRAGYSWWQKIAHVEHFDSLNQITWVVFGTVGSLPTVAEGAEYAELKIGDSPETSNFTKYGGFIGITREAIDRDETRKLRAIPRELANAGLRNISALVSAVFTDNSGVGPTLADGGALFNATAVTTAGGHANLLTTALGTDYTAWNTVSAAMYNQPMLIANETSYYGAGKKMAVEPKYCLVPRALKSQAEALFLPRWGNPIDTVQAPGGVTYGGYVEPITVPEWTDATDWAAVADPLIVPGICIGERFGLIPEVYLAGDETGPAAFSNDELRIKVHHFIAVGVADYRPLHKSNV